MSELREAVLHCAICSREIHGVTGLDELHNMRVHLAEHHDLIWDDDGIWQILDLRERWEREGWRW